MNNTQDFIELDLTQIIRSIWHRLWAVILAAAVFGGAAFAGTYYLITPKYQASALLYVNNSSFSVGSSSFSISSSELTAAQSLVDTYIVILTTRTTLTEVIETAHVDYTYEELKRMISAGAVNSTEVFEIVVTSASPTEAELLANTITAILPDKIAGVVEGSSVRIVDYAVKPSQRSSPSYSKNTLIGVLLGIVVSVGIIVLREMFDVFVRSDQYLTQNYEDIPVLAVIPDLRASGSSGKYYSSSSYSKASSDKTSSAKGESGRVG